MPVRVVYSLWAVCNAHLPGEPELPSGLAGSSLPCFFPLVTERHPWGQFDAKSDGAAGTQCPLVESWSHFGTRHLSSVQLAQGFTKSQTGTTLKGSQGQRELDKNYGQATLCASNS